MLDHLFRRHRSLRLALLVPAAIAVMALAAACGGGGDDDDDDNGNGNGGDNGNGVSSEPITIQMKDNLFDPKSITIPVNTEVEITVDNLGTAVHNMRILSKDDDGKDFTSELLVNPGKSSTFTVKLSKAKTYDFQCDYHLPDMAGTITVQ